MQKEALLLIWLLIANVNCALATGPSSLPATRPTGSSTSSGGSSPVPPSNPPSGSAQPTSNPSTGGAPKPPQASAISSSTPAQNPTYTRLSSVQRDGESLADCLARLSPGQPITPPNTGGRRLFVDDQVQVAFNSFKSQASITESDQPTQSIKTTTGTGYCMYQGMSFSHGTNEFLNFDNAVSGLFPGSVLQARFLSGVHAGTDSQVPVPVSTNMKNPSIKIYDPLSVDTYTLPYDLSSISRSISGAIGQAMNWTKSNTIFFEMGTSDDLYNFGFSRAFDMNLQKKLGLYRPPNSALNTYLRKLIFFFVKPIGTFPVLIDSPDPNDPNTPLNTFFSNILTPAEVVKRTPSWWGPNNPPVYIDKVTYGSMIALTVDFTPATEALYYSLDSAITSKSGTVQSILNQIASHTSLKVISVGPFSPAELSVIKSGNWNDFMFQVPNGLTNQLIHPLIYTVKDFNQANYNSINTFDYVKISCGTGTGPSTNSGGSNNGGSTNNGSSNNGGSTNNGSSNNGSSNNGSSNNGSSNNGGSTNNGSSNNGGSNPGGNAGHKIYIQLQEILTYAPVNVWIWAKNETLISTKKFTQASKLHLNPFFDQDSQIIVSVRPTSGQKDQTSVLQQNVKISFEVDGVLTLKGTSNCKGNFCYELDIGVFSVNKVTGIIAP